MTVDVLENSVAKFADITIITIKKCCNGSQTCFAETFLGVVATYFSLFTFSLSRAQCRSGRVAEVVFVTLGEVGG